MRRSGLYSLVAKVIVLMKSRPLYRSPPCLFIISLCATMTVTTSPGSYAATEQRALTAQASSSPGLVNLNTATVAELTRLPHIGRTRAEAIVTYRRKRRFKRVREIRRIRGIGRKTFRVLRPFLTLSGPTTLKPRPPRRRLDEP